jgi:histidinol-phosphate/aromatic aminotransferase/cobyric acid decarboxylase-like protein
MAEPTPTIYSYYSPEIRGVVRQNMLQLNTGIGHHVSIHDTLKQNYSPGLDDLHLPLLSKYEQFARSEGVIGLDTFDNKYFTNGSSEAIFHLIVGLLPAEQLYQFEGEYQGYEALANSVGRSIITVKGTGELMSLKPGILIVSNPASKHGNRISGLIVKEWGKKHRIVLDLAYMGMTQEPLNLDLTDDAIIAVVGSLSKPFGLYYYRIGFCYSKWPVQSLVGNKWFKNALSIKLGEAVLDAWTPMAQTFKDKYFALQEKAVVAANSHFGFTSYNSTNQIKPSDVWLLGALHRPYSISDNYDPSDLKPFKRVEGVWRFCLTPYYLEEENS